MTKESEALKNIRNFLKDNIKVSADNSATDDFIAFRKKDSAEKIDTYLKKV